MNDQVHHQSVVDQVYEQLHPIFENSEQSIYLYLDEVHKVCNQNFADLLGYDSPEEWAGVSDFMTFVHEDSQQLLVTTYQNAMTRLNGSTIEVTWNKKSGGTVSTTCILVPLSFDGHVLALHFIS